MKPVSSFIRAFFVVFLLVGVARSEPATPPPSELRPVHGYYSAGTPRWFVSARPELGTPYLKPYFSAGYGLPHWFWAGVDVNAIVTAEMTQAYAGVRAASPVLDVAFGARDTWSYRKRFLPARASYTRSDVFAQPLPLARYWAWEGEVMGVLPLPHSAVITDFVVVRTLDVPRGRYVYDESYRAIIAKPTFAVFRVAAVARLLREDSLKLGPLFEHVFETGRPGGVVRLGPAVALQLTDHLEAFATLTFPLSSPDRLGLTVGSYGVAGVRFRWATGELRPSWPWREQLIP